MLLSLAQGSRGARKKLSDFEFVSSQSLLRRFKYPKVDQKILSNFNLRFILLRSLLFFGRTALGIGQPADARQLLSPHDGRRHPWVELHRNLATNRPFPQNGKEFLTGMRVVYIDIMIHCYCLDRRVTM